MKKVLLGIMVFFLLLFLMITGNAYCQTTYPFMRPGSETLRQWAKEYEMTPETTISEGIHLMLEQSAAQGLPTSVDLQSYLKYYDGERNQGPECGNCWVWAGTGVMEIALNTHMYPSRPDQLSIQFFNSCYGTWPGLNCSFACCGGTLGQFASWYNENKFAIPWSNQHAYWQDFNAFVGHDEGVCPDTNTNTPCYGTSNVQCDYISRNSYYPINYIQANKIATTSVILQRAILNIKNVLSQSKGVYFAFFFPNFYYHQKFI